MEEKRRGTSPPILRKEEREALQKARELLLPLKEKYGLDSQQVAELLEQEISLPDTALARGLTTLESAVKYLKEERQLAFSEIAPLIGRDQRNVWHTYKAALSKHPARIPTRNVKLWIPASIFSCSRLSAMEALVAHLKERAGLSLHEIAMVMKRDDRTIWTVYHRARRKNERKA